MPQSVVLKSRLPMIAAELRAKGDAIAKGGAELIAEGAKQRVPVDQGDLRDAIHTERQGAGSYAVVAGDEQVFYGHMVEHGTSHTAPKPFLIPTLEASREPVIGLAVAALRLL